jgi:hypothetical protein
MAEGKNFDQCFDQACKLYDRAQSKDLNPKLVQVADFQGDGTDADARWLKLPQHVWQHYVVIVGDQVLDPTAKQFGNAMPTQYQVSDLDRLWAKQYQIRPRSGVAEDMAQKNPVIRTVADFYINDVGHVDPEPLDDYVAQARDLLSQVQDQSLKAKIADILKQAYKNPTIQGGVITTVGALLAGGVLASAQKFGLSPTQTNMALQAILNTVIPTMVSRVNGRNWRDTMKYTLASAGIGTGIAAVTENFKDGKNPQDQGDSARHGIPKNATIAQLKQIRSSKTASPRKKQLAHWQINMRQGRAKAK